MNLNKNLHSQLHLDSAMPAPKFLVLVVPGTKNKSLIWASGQAASTRMRTTLRFFQKFPDWKQRYHL